MTDIIPFEVAVKRTEACDRSLLLGNGFSIQYFNYKNLLDEAQLDDAEPAKSLFGALDTFDFETVIRALEEAATVEKAYGNDDQAEGFIKDAERLREGLVHAVRTIHPAHREDIVDLIPSCIRFLKNFERVFTLNYDLLLYWVLLESPRSFKDGFGLGSEASGFRSPFKEEAYCNVYNLHGGLHLFKTPIGQIKKRLMGASGVIDAIAETITRNKHLPLYVAEGTSTKKLSKINSVPYLRHCLNKLGELSGAVFIYGHSADQNDGHIYKTLFKSNIEAMYFCIHRPTADVDAISGELARYKAKYQSKVDYTFVDAESAQVWDGPADADT
jgi:Domain of unknown function (DUF4917)